MYIFGFIFFLLALLSPSLPLPLSTYRPGEVTNSSTTPGTTIMHGRCGVHITHRMTGVWDPVLALQGSITGYILDANHTEIGKLSKRYYNIRHQVVEFHSRLDDVLCIAPGGTVQFELGGHSWNSTDGRCSVGNWKRTLAGQSHKDSLDCNPFDALSRSSRLTDTGFHFMGQHYRTGAPRS